MLPTHVGYFADENSFQGAPYGALAEIRNTHKQTIITYPYTAASFNDMEYRKTSDSSCGPIDVHVYAWFHSFKVNSEFHKIALEVFNQMFDILFPRSPQMVMGQGGKQHVPRFK